MEAFSDYGGQISRGSGELSEPDIRRHLRTEMLGRVLEVKGITPSTNLYLKERDTASLPEGFAVIANGQTSGRGRMGRAFSSPAGSGVYLSVLLRPALPLADVSFLTVCAAVAVCEMLLAEYRVNAGIKWVNDIYHDGLKLCGILTEALPLPKQDLPRGQGLPQDVIVGIGINTGRVADEVQDIATSLMQLTGLAVSRNRLAAETLNHLERVYLEFVQEGGKGAILKRYSDLLFMLDREIEVRGPGGSFTARAVALNENGALVVETPDGRRQTLLSEDVHIRLQ